MKPLTAIIPIRGGSKGLPGKNTRHLGGVPLYQHTVEHALKAGITDIIISTDIPEVLATNHGPHIQVDNRHSSLCGDDVPMSSVLCDLISRSEFALDKTVVLLQATCPLRHPHQIISAVEQFNSTTFDLVMSVCEAERAIWKHGTVVDGAFLPLRSEEDLFTNRQMLPQIFRPNGSIYVFSSDWFRARGTLATRSISAFVMSQDDSIDIDSVDDFKRCERILIRRSKE